MNRLPREEGAPLSNADEVTDLAGVRVLVVDDEQDSLDMMEAALHHAGALVTAVPSAKKALEELNRATPDVIVCDLKMPEDDGLAFARELQAVPSLRSIPILAVTAYDRLYVRQKLNAAGFMGFLHKPTTFSSLAAAQSVAAPSRRFGRPDKLLDHGAAIGNLWR